MNNLNSVLVEGNLVKDPVVKEVHGNRKVANFTIASDRFYKSEEDEAYVKKTSFFDVEAWNNPCVESIQKGAGVRLVGRLKQSRWQIEGEWHSKVVIVAEHIEKKPSKHE